MILGSTKASLLLLVGDIAAFALSLWLTLLLRYQAWPSSATLAAHLPFVFLFVLWLLVFYMAGLYGKRIVFARRELPDALLKTQFFNIVLAALFFFLVPVGIAPKTNLLIYLVVSLLVIYGWRLWLYPLIARSRAASRAALIAEGKEADELVAEVNGNPKYGLRFSYIREPRALPATEAFMRELAEEHISLIVADTSALGGHATTPILAALSAASGRYLFVDFEDAYEEIFDRIPLSRLAHEWFLRNVPSINSLLYSLAKRTIDLLGGVVMGLVTLLATPFIFLANLLEGPGPLFIRQDRLGMRGARVRAYKFRSMREHLAASGEWTSEGENRVTKVGSFLRKTSLDEFPQFINVLAGEISLVGPRNDIEGLGARLADAIPYYNARYLVKPGITGWAQINQQYEPGNASPQSVAETKMRLAYDFYYLKNRSLGLDLVIALKTIKRMFFRVSSW